MNNIDEDDEVNTSYKSTDNNRSSKGLRVNQISIKSAVSNQIINVDNIDVDNYEEAN